MLQMHASIYMQMMLYYIGKQPHMVVNQLQEVLNIVQEKVGNYGNKIHVFFKLKIKGTQPAFSHHF